MRKPSKRWIALASTTLISVAGLALTSGAAADDEEPLPWPVVQQNASSYTLDGFTIGYLPSGLEEHGLNAKSATDEQGGRTSDITWLDGPDEIYGKIEVLRDEDIASLGDLRRSRYGHLDAGHLEEINSNGREAYLSRGTGDLFWVEEPGLAVTIYLRPDTWDSGELTQTAAFNERREETESQGERVRSPRAPGGDAEADGFGNDPPEALDTPEGEAPGQEPHADPEALEGGTPESERPGAGAPEGTGNGADTRGELPLDVSELEVREFLAEQAIGAVPGNTEETALNAGSVAGDEARFAELWRATDEAHRENAVNGCAEYFGIDPSVVEAIVEAAERAAGETGTGDGALGIRDALAWTLPSAPMNR